METATKASCVMCGSDRLRLEETEKPAAIEGTDVKVPFRMHWCEACGTEMALNEDLRFNARAMRQARKKRYGFLTGEEVRRIRKQLGLSQEQAALLFGGGPVAFSKYENDEVTQSEAMDRLIWLVGSFPGLVRLIAAHVNVALPEQAGVVLEKRRIAFDEKYSIFAHIVGEDSVNAFKGFYEFSSAGNDQIYRPNVGARPTNWKAA